MPESGYSGLRAFFRRPISFLALPSARTLILACALAVAIGCGASDDDADAFNGTVLRNENAGIAPDFELLNQDGSRVSMDDMRGRVVVLTFLYTSCPDVCPIVTSQLRDVQTALGPHADGAEFVAMSVDPERDTVEAARDYLERWGLGEGWQYLVGERSELEDLWATYYVSPIESNSDGVPATPSSTGERTATGGATDKLGARIAERYLVIHSAPVYLIDREGRRRVAHTMPLEPEKIAEDVERLLSAGD